ncbi:MAG TPA: universal stress protein [Steroidobacteraceae bacterium]|nr:universal stress protein [Steroidobacteraceae bacterium]
MYEHILVGVDGSDTGKRGLGEALRLAKALGTQLRIVHVVNKMPWVTMDVDGSMLQEIMDQLRSHGESILQEALATARTAGVQAEGRLLEAPGSSVGQCLIEEASSWKAALIVCGTHGRGGVRRIVMGSDAEYVVRHSSAPVLLVRAAAG